MFLSQEPSEISLSQTMTYTITITFCRYAAHPSVRLSASFSTIYEYDLVSPYWNPQ